MKTNLWQKIKTIGLSNGLLGVAVLVIEILFWSSFSNEIHKLFYGGQPGAFVTGIFIIIGVISTLLFVLNLFFKRFSSW